MVPLVKVPHHKNDMKTAPRVNLMVVGKRTRRFIFTCLAVGALTPALAGVVARIWLTRIGVGVAPWGEALLEVLLPTVFLVLPIYIMFSVAALKFLPASEKAPQFQQRMSLFSGALVGLTLPVVGTLYYLYLQGSAALLLLALPWFLMITTLGALAGAGVGWLVGKVVFREHS